MFARLRSLGQNPSGTRLRGALREAYLTACALLGAPGLLLGLIFGWGLRPSKLEVGVLLGLALALALLAAVLAARGRTREVTPLAGAVRASVQLASAPAVPFLLGCTALGSPLALALFWGLALLLGWLGWLMLSGWAREAARGARADGWQSSS